jgi:predicted metal-dependent enzyme (double-stranded beta helix superfamily)
MLMTPSSHDDLRDRCAGWSAAIAEMTSDASRIAYVHQKLPALLENQPLMAAILRAIKQDTAASERARRTLFDNEWLLLMDANRRFSLRLYIYKPGEVTFIHDHSSWGVLGAASGKLAVAKYRRKDSGERSGYAFIEEVEQLICEPGHTDATLPLDEGIHRVANPTDRTIAVISVYGTPLRRLYINRFDAERRTVSKVYPPRLYRRMLAADALACLDANETP